MISDFQLYVKTRPSALGKSVLGVGPSDILDILQLETPLFSSALSTLSVCYVNIVIFNGLVSSAFLVHCVTIFLCCLAGEIQYRMATPYMRRTIINGIAAAILDRIDCSFFAKKNTVLISQLFKNYLGPKKIIFGALMRHFFQTLVLFHKLRIIFKD